MKIGSNLQFEIPDQCPETCSFINERAFFDQSSVCCRCPVMNCSGLLEYRLMDPWDYDDDCAAEWVTFFGDNRSE